MKIVFFFVGLILFVSCRRSYDPGLPDKNRLLLVIEANINPGGGTTVRLTRTAKLDVNTTIQSENNAQVTVEGKDNSSRILTFSGNGNYTTNAGFVIGNEYRLHIRTASGKEYISKYIKAQKTPDIDSISWERESRGVRIQANTHDPDNATRYYRWEYVETWQYNSPFPPNLIYVNGTIRNRVFPAENVNVCWTTKPSTSITIANSTKLEKDIISRSPLIFIPNDDEKLSQRYSVILSQYALSKEAYDFYELLKKNTESIGSIFDPQPSEATGNFSCVSDPAEQVIGFLTASTVTTKRIFINTQEVQPWNTRYGCQDYRIRKNPDSIKEAISNSLIPIDDLQPDPYYTFSQIQCVDCTAKGGTTTKPSFW